MAVALAFLVSFGPSGCATSDEDSKPVTYSLTAKQNYQKGLAELKDENYPEAQKYFQFVKQKYPFSKFAVLSELALADTQFARGNYNEAIDSYKSFARLHPTHEKVEDGYVGFKVGESYCKDMPDDIWILPPSYEKDQSAVIDALRELDDFLKKFPTSPTSSRPTTCAGRCSSAWSTTRSTSPGSTLRGDHPKAAAMRLEGAIRRYPGFGARAGAAVPRSAETYLQHGDPHGQRRSSPAW